MLWSARFLDLNLTYFECDACGYVQTERPYWLDRAYSEAINDSDTGIMARNIYNARVVLATLLVLGRLNGTVVDCAGGYGILVRLLRDCGVNALWNDRYCENLVARGFAHTGGRADLVTAFEAFEHFVDPLTELRRLLTISDHALISTKLIPRPTPGPDDWWYYDSNHGQHIGFFRVETLKSLATATGTHVVTYGCDYHLFSQRPINAIAWRAAIGANRLTAWLAESRLRSLTWPDHLTMTARKDL